MRSRSRRRTKGGARGDEGGGGGKREEGGGRRRGGYGVRAIARRTALLLPPKPTPTYSLITSTRSRHMISRAARARSRCDRTARARCVSLCACASRRGRARRAAGDSCALCGGRRSQSACRSGSQRSARERARRGRSARAARSPRPSEDRPRRAARSRSRVCTRGSAPSFGAAENTTETLHRQSAPEVADACSCEAADSSAVNSTSRRDSSRVLRRGKSRCFLDFKFDWLPRYCRHVLECPRRSMRVTIQAVPDNNGEEGGERGVCSG